LKPFLRYAGGKSRLVKTLKSYMPKDFDADTWLYIEPFLGSGALFLDLQPKNAYVGDANAALINTWQQIRGSREALAARLMEFSNDEASYYKERDCYNNDLPGLTSVDAEGQLVMAARFIYLNRTGFNGIYRVSKSTGYNVPYGHLKNPTVLNNELLKEIQSYIESNRISLRLCNFTFPLLVPHYYPEDKTFIYADPPYDSEDGKGHVNYTARGFSRDDQAQLAEILSKGSKRTMVSNANTPFIRELYKDWCIVDIEVRRSVAANGDRPKAREVLIMNY